VREITLQLSPYKVFLVFLYLCVVMNKNLKDDTLSSLSNLHNMQIKSAITKKPFSGYSSLTNRIMKVIYLHIPIFSGSFCQLRLIPKCSRDLHRQNMLIRFPIAKIAC